MMPHRACTHDRQSFVSRRLSILVLSNYLNCSLWTADVTDWVKQEPVSYRTGWHTVWSTSWKTLTMIFFNRVLLLHNENHVLHPLLPERNDHCLNCDADAMNVGYSYAQWCQTQLYIQTVTQIGLALTFPPANFLLFNCDLSIHNTQ